MTVSVLGDTVSWTIPCFPVLAINFKKVVFLFEGNEIKGLIQKCQADHLSPLQEIKCKKHCNIQLNEEKFLVVWEWCLVAEDNTSQNLMQSSETDPHADQQEDQNVFGLLNNHSPDALDDEDDAEVEEEDEEEEGEEEEREISHTLPFKVIGVAHTLETQRHLEISFELLHSPNAADVHVKVEPEPNNEKDKNAIAVYVDYGSDWKRIGYIASELTPYVHQAIISGDLVKSEIGHIKFRVHWMRAGFYMKLLLTKRGVWDHYVSFKSRSVM